MGKIPSPPGGGEYQLTSFGEKILKDKEKKGENVKEKGRKGKEKGRKGKEKGRKGKKMRKGEVKG